MQNVRIVGLKGNAEIRPVAKVTPDQLRSIAGHDHTVAVHDKQSPHPRHGTA